VLRLFRNSETVEESSLLMLLWWHSSHSSFLHSSSSWVFHSEASHSSDIVLLSEHHWCQKASFIENSLHLYWNERLVLKNLDWNLRYQDMFLHDLLYFLSQFYEFINIWLQKILQKISLISFAIHMRSQQELMIIIWCL